MADVFPLKLVAVGGGQGELREFAAGDALQLQGALNLAGILSVASAGTVDIGAEESNTLSVSGTTTITSLGSAGAGVYRWLVFEGVLTLTHNATSLILPGGANITTAAGDAGLFFSLGGGNWRCLHYPSAGGGGSGLTVYAKAYHTANVSVPNATFTELAMDTTLAEAGGNLHNPASNPERITIPAGAAGGYVVGGAAFFAANATGRRVIRIQKNGTVTVVREDKQAVSTSGASTGILGSTMTYLEEGDYITCQVYQDSGGALNVNGLAEYSPQVWVARIGG